MAVGGKVKGITIEFNGDTTKLGNALKQIDSKSKSVDRSLQQVNRALRFNPKNTELVAQKQVLLKQKIDQTNQRLEALRQTQKKLDDDPSVENDSQEYMELRREIITTESKLKHFEAEQRKLNNIKFDQLGNSFKNAGQKMQNVGRNMSMYVTAPLAGIGGLAIKTGMDFESAMSQVAATMGTTSDKIQNLSEFARQMGATTKFSATEAAQGLNYMALAGYDAEKSMKMLPVVLNLAAAGNMDLARASDMVTDAQSAMGLSVDETVTLVDQMAAAAASSNTSVEQLGEAMLTVGGTARVMKGGTQEAAQVLGLLADNGVKGSEGGTALRNILLSLSNPTNKAAQEMEKLGLKVFDSQGNMRSMKDIMLDLGGSLSGLTTKEQMQALGKIFNKRDLKSVNALLGTSADRWEELGEKIGNSNGAAGEMAATQLDNLKGQITIIQSALQEAGIAIAETLEPYIKKAADFIQNLVDKFNGLSPGKKKFIVFAGAIIAALGPVILMLGLFSSAIGSIIKILPMLGKAITSSFGVWGLVIAGVIAAVVLLWKNWDKIKKMLIVIWNAIKKAFLTVFNAIKTAIITYWKTIWTITKTVWTTIFNVLKTIWTAIKTAASVVLNAIVGLFRKAWAAIKAAWAGVKSFFIGIWNGIKSAFANVGTWFAAKFLAAAKAVKSAFSSVKSFFSGVWSKIKGVFGNVAGFFKSKFSAAWSAVKGVFSNVGSFFGSVFSKIKNKFKSLGSTLGSAIGGSVAAGINGIIGFIERTLNRAIGLINGAIRLINKVKPGKDIGQISKLSLPRISWHKKGGIFDSPSVIGVGEAGAEAVVPLNKFWKKMDKMAENMGAPIVVNVYGSENMNVNELAVAVQNKIIQLQKRKNSAWA